MAAAARGGRRVWREDAVVNSWLVNGDDTILHRFEEHVVVEELKLKLVSETS